jgi:hypothetical protein
MWSSRRKAKRVQTGVTTIAGMDEMLSRCIEVLRACEIRIQQNGKGMETLGLDVLDVRGPIWKPVTEKQR